MGVLGTEAGPQQSTRAFAESISRGDLDAAARCFAKDACRHPPPPNVAPSPAR
ncbi:MAG TPA: hypothetical protein VFP21_10615 [Solirubrobacterales bacterium]|nr:hypothetical protein [Solirubrobacterales bacterium]